MADENTFKSTYQILKDLSSVWGELQDTEQAYLLEKIAGKHRATAIAAILSNGEQLSEAYITALRSAGSAMTEFEKRTGSIEYHIAQLQAAWQELATNTATVEFINSIIDGLRALIETVNELGTGNVVATMTAMLTGFMTVTKGFPMLESIGLKDLSESINSINTSSSTENLEEMADAVKDVTDKTSELGDKGTESLDKYTAGQKRARGASVLLGKAVSGLMKTMAITAVVFVAIKAIGFLTDKMFEYANRLETAEAEVNDMTNSLTNMKEEYDALKKKGSLSEEEKERLEHLEKSITLQERDLELSKQRYAVELNNKINKENDSTYFGNSDKIREDQDIDPDQQAYFYTKTTENDEITSLNSQAISSFVSAKKSADEYNESLGETRTQLSLLSKFSDERSEIQQREIELTQLATDAEKQQNESYSTLSDNYKKMIDRREDLQTIIENGVDISSTDLDARKKELDVLNDQIIIQEALLGLQKEVNTEFVSEQQGNIDLYNKLRTALDKVAVGARITEEEFNLLKQQFPQLAQATQDCAKDQDGAYSLSKEAVQGLSAVQATCFSTMNNNEITKTIVAKEQAIQRLKIYQEEAKALRQMANTIDGVDFSGWVANTEWLKDNPVAQSVAKAIDGNADIKAGQINAKADKIEQKVNAEKENIDALDSQLSAIMDALNGINAGTSETLDGLNGNGGGGGNEDGDKDKSSKTETVWDKYANDIKRFQELVEQCDAEIDRIQSKIDLNESFGLNNPIDTEALTQVQTEYEEALAHVKELGVDTNQTIFGNIDLNNRQVLEWTKETVGKYRSQLESWGANADEMIGSISTVFGASSNFDGLEIAFSPMLQTENGAVLLDESTVHNYINSLMQKLSSSGKWTSADLIALDAQGLEVDGQKIKGLIADIGDTAISTGEAMHYLGKDGELSNLKTQIEDLSSSSALQEQLNLYDKLIAINKEKQKLANNIAWEEIQYLDKLNADLSKQLEITVDNKTTTADLEKQFQKTFGNDTNSKVAQIVSQMISARDSLNSQKDSHVNLRDECKKTVNELNGQKVTIFIEVQNEQLDRVSALRNEMETQFDMLDDINGAEEVRKIIGEGLIDTYQEENRALDEYISYGYQALKTAKDEKATEETISKITEQILSLQEQKLDNLDKEHQKRLQLITDTYDLQRAEAERQVYGEQGQKAYERNLEKQVNSLQKELDALERDTREEDFQKEAEEKRKEIADLEKKLQNLKTQRTVQELQRQEDGSYQWNYVVDEVAIQDTQSELDEKNAELNKLYEDKRIEDEKQAIQDRIDAINLEKETKQQLYDDMLFDIEEREKKAIEIENNAHLERIKLHTDVENENIRHLGKMESTTKEGLDKVNKETDSALDLYETTWTTRMNNTFTVIHNTCNNMIADFDATIRRHREMLEELAKQSIDDVGGNGSPKANGLKFVDRNNLPVRLHYGERVLTRQEARQYNELESVIKSGEVASLLNEATNEARSAFSNIASRNVSATSASAIPLTTNNTSNSNSIVIQNVTLPEVKDPQDFANVISQWMRNEFSGFGQRGKIIPAR